MDVIEVIDIVKTKGKYESQIRYQKDKYTNDEDFRKNFLSYLRNWHNNKYHTDEAFREKRKQTRRESYMRTKLRKQQQAELALNS